MAGGSPPVKVAAYDTTGKLVMTFNTVREAAEHFGVSQPNVSYAVSDPNRSVKNHRLRRYEGDPEHEINEAQPKMIAIYSLEGKLVKVVSRPEATKFLGAKNPVSITQALRSGPSSVVKGHYIRLVHSEDTAPDQIDVVPHKKRVGRSDSFRVQTRLIEQINLVTGEVVAVYHGASEAGRAVGATRQAIHAAAGGAYSQVKGFGWRFQSDAGVPPAARDLMARKHDLQHTSDVLATIQRGDDPVRDDVVKAWTNVNRIIRETDAEIGDAMDEGVVEEDAAA